jgi:hypothetical protein
MTGKKGVSISARNMVRRRNEHAPDGTGAIGLKPRYQAVGMKYVPEMSYTISVCKPYNHPHASHDALAGNLYNFLT